MDVTRTEYAVITLLRPDSFLGYENGEWRN